MIKETLGFARYLLNLICNQSLVISEGLARRDHLFLHEPYRHVCGRSVFWHGMPCTWVYMTHKTQILKWRATHNKPRTHILLFCPSWKKTHWLPLVRHWFYIWLSSLWITNIRNRKIHWPLQKIYRIICRYIIYGHISVRQLLSLW